MSTATTPTGYWFTTAPKPCATCVTLAGLRSTRRPVMTGTRTILQTPGDKRESTPMQSDQTVVEFTRCRRKQRMKAVTHALASGESRGFRPSAVVTAFCIGDGNPQSGLANGPMSGPHSCTDGIAVATPMPVAFHSDHENEQPKPTAASPRYGRSIDGIWRSACSSPHRWLKTLRSGVLGSRHACSVDSAPPSVYDHAIPAEGDHHA